jgi:hypothetical protein
MAVFSEIPSDALFYRRSDRNHVLFVDTPRVDGQHTIFPLHYDSDIPESVHVIRAYYWGDLSRGPQNDLRRRHRFADVVASRCWRYSHRGRYKSVGSTYGTHFVRVRPRRRLSQSRSRWPAKRLAVDDQSYGAAVVSQTPRPPIKWAVCPECRQRAGLPREESLVLGKSVDYECEQCGHLWTVPQASVRPIRPNSEP